jgi:hypothetical protein
LPRRDRQTPPAGSANGSLSYRLGPARSSCPLQGAEHRLVGYKMRCSELASFRYQWGAELELHIQVLKPFERALEGFRPIDVADMLASLEFTKTFLNVRDRYYELNGQSMPSTRSVLNKLYGSEIGSFPTRASCLLTRAKRNLMSHRVRPQHRTADQLISAADFPPSGFLCPLTSSHTYNTQYKKQDKMAAFL